MTVRTVRTRAGRLAAGGFVLGLAALAGRAGAGTLVDNFNNGNPVDADAAAGFWTVATGAPGGVTATTESGGLLRLTAGNDANANNGAILHLAESGEWNPFTQTTTYSARGIGFSQNGTAFPFTGMQLRFALVSTANNTFSADDAIILTGLGSSRVTFDYKDNAPNASVDGEGTRLVDLTTTSGDANNFWRGFDLTLGPAPAAGELAYALTLIGANTTLPTQTGTFPLTAATWGDGGNAALVLWAQELNNTSTTQNFTATIDSFTAAVPEPGAATAAAVGLCALMGGRRRRRRRA